MFTGIVEEVGQVRKVTATDLVVAAQKVLDGTHIGDSIAVNGACLTLVEMTAGEFKVNVVPETLRRTNLGGLKPGGIVNLERSLALGGRISGHVVQGHIDGTVEVVEIRPESDAWMGRFRGERELLEMVVEKGFVSLDGISLTVVDCREDSFRTTIIPFTRENTNFKVRKVGDRINLEVDILAKYVKKLLHGERPAPLTP